MPHWADATPSDQSCVLSELLQYSLTAVDTKERLRSSLLQQGGTIPDPKWARLPVLLKREIQSHISSKWTQSFGVENLTHSCVSTQIFMASFSRNPPGRAPWTTGSLHPNSQSHPSSIHRALFKPRPFSSRDCQLCRVAHGQLSLLGRAGHESPATNSPASVQDAAHRNYRGRWKWMKE